MKRQPSKPVGTMGQVLMTAEGAEFQKLKLPRTKAEIEAFMVRGFANAVQRVGLQVLKVHQNAEADFDFRIDTNRGSKNLELMEIAPLEHLRGSHESAPSTYKTFDFAEYIYGKAMGKSARYAGAKGSGIVLLVYVTSFQFVLSQTVRDLLGFWFVMNPHSFDGVYSFHPLGDGFGIADLVYPTPREAWMSFDPNAVRENVVQNLSPLEWKAGDAE